MGVRFTRGQKLFIGFWIVMGIFWCYDLVAWRHSQTTAIIGLVTALLGILTQIQLARRNLSS